MNLVLWVIVMWVLGELALAALLAIYFWLHDKYWIHRAAVRSRDALVAHR